MRLLFLAALGVGGAYLFLLGWMYFNQRKLQYFPSHRDEAAKGHGPFLPWVSRSGEFLGYFRLPNQHRATVLFFHGNAGEALDRAWLAEALPPDVLLILPEYPGFGGRKGTPTQEAIYQAADEAYQEAIRQSQAPIWVVGESLGSGVACYVAKKWPTAKLALISPFSAAVDVAAWAYPFAPVRLLMKDPFPSRDYVGGISTPTHLIHGTDDTTIPVEQARALMGLFPHGKAVLTEVPGYGHSDIDDAILRSPRAEPFRAFLRQ